MIKRLLVPLDGSDLAEEALRIASDMAEGVNGVLVLARVVPPPVPGRFYAPNLLDQVQEAQAREAEAYLEALAERLKKDRLHVETRVLKGEVASTLVRLAEQERCELIAMSSHGLGGVGWHVFGSVAQKVLHSSRCPVLIVRPPVEEFEREEEKEEQLLDEALLSELSSGEPAGR
ncbi:MAG: universal stress protein [Dehalococcoidia bacterium]